MAVSFPRPDPSSPASIARAGFGTVRKGFDQSEVREFLALVATEMGRLREREQYLEALLLETRDAKNASSELIDEDTATRLLGEEAAHILHAARESAASVKAKAEDGASTILGDATQEATRVREDAEVEAARRRSEATADAENQIAMAKQQGREMVNEARSYRERVLSELARRRDLARTQIEQLVQGRQQLLGTFTEARDTADGVIRQLGPMGDVEAAFELPPPPLVPPADEADETGETGETGDAGETGDEELRTGAFFDQDAFDDPGPVEPAFADDPVPVPGTDGAPESRGSVVELFPGSAQDQDGDAASHSTSAGSDEDTAQSTTVDNLFAKLRAASAEEEDEEDDAVETPADEPTSPDELASQHDTTEIPVTDDLALPGAGAEITRQVDPEADHPPTDADPSTNGSTTAQSSDPDDVADVPSDDEASASDESSSPFAHRDEALTPLIVSAARRIKRVLADEQNELLDTLRQSEPVLSIDALLVADRQQVGRYVDSITTELEGAAQAGATSVNHDATTEVTRAGALGPVRDLIALNLVVPLRERLERCVADGEGDNEVITKRVRSVYREWKTQHVDNQLDDVFRLAYGRGVLVALPVGTPVRWLVDPDGPACPDAEDNSLAGVVPAGDPFPTGHVCAPAHAACRCLLAPADR